MHARACNGSHVHHRAFGSFELLGQTARKHDGREEVHPEHLLPDVDRGVDGGQALSSFGLGRDRCIVHERVELLGVEPLFDLGDRSKGPLRVREVDLNVVFRPHFPRAVLGKGVSRAGYDPPARCREPFHGGVADAAACPGQEESSARIVWLDHIERLTSAGRIGGLGVEPRFAPGRIPRCAAKLDPIMQPKWPVLPELHDERG